ncbi:MAG: DUF1501 domain-containing protein [Methylophilaceae bacterium]
MNRRNFLRLSALSGSALFAWPCISFATANTDRRFIFIIQRGAADGLNTVIPYADPNYAKLRGALAIDVSQAHQLDSMFALHPALKQTAQLYDDHQALFVHAVASPYRERSHFDGQNVLETGGKTAYQFQDGWMNRLLTLLPITQNEAIAFAATIPMALRGNRQVSSYAPTHLPQAPDDLLMRVSQLYAEDAQLNPLWTAAMAANNMAEDATAKQDPASLGNLVASFLIKPQGPRIAMIETGGWDTHSGQEGRLARQLSALDSMISSLKIGLGETWQKTTVVIATEFGRTAAANGTGGTDHGTASVCMVLGGDVKGGRVLADWPSLSQNQLYEGRDLKPTTQLNHLFTSIISESFAIDPNVVAKALWMETSQNKAMTGLIKI